MNGDELKRVNDFRKKRGRAELDTSPGMRFLNYGKGRDGYWDYDHFARQVGDLMDATWRCSIPTGRCCSR